MKTIIWANREVRTLKEEYLLQNSTTSSVPITLSNFQNSRIYFFDPKTQKNLRGPNKTNLYIKQGACIVLALFTLGLFLVPLACKSKLNTGKWFTFFHSESFNPFTDSYIQILNNISKELLKTLTPVQS